MSLTHTHTHTHTHHFLSNLSSTQRFSELLVVLSKRINQCTEIDFSNHPRINVWCNVYWPFKLSVQVAWLCMVCVQTSVCVCVCVRERLCMHANGCINMPNMCVIKPGCMFYSCNVKAFPTGMGRTGFIKLTLSERVLYRDMGYCPFTSKARQQ